MIDPPRAAAGFGFLPAAGRGGRRGASVSSSADGDVSEYGGSASLHAPSVQICDGAFSPAACEVLRCLAVEGTLRRDSDATVLFVRPPSNATALTPLEHAIDSALTALGDGTAAVEYWYRDEHMNLDAHVDLDEVAFDEESETGGITAAASSGREHHLMSPAASHVLYLRVREDLRGQAPTVLFPGAERGRAIVNTCASNAGHGDKAEPTRSGGGDREAASELASSAGMNLVTVPAVQGRLLRFPGDVLHAVPCPADRWLLSAEDERTLRHEEMLEEEMGEEEDEEEEEDYDADYDADGDEVERAVLLFNTWPDGPPSSGHGMDYADEDGEAERQERVAEWTEDYGVDAALLRCRPRAQWQIQALGKAKKEDDDGDDGMATARVHLMQRSALPEEPWLVRVHEESMRGALGQKRDPTWLSFWQ